MVLTEAQELFSLFFGIYFALVIDRSHQAYNPWDTYNAWKGTPHKVKRLMVAWVILFIVPIIHFSILFGLLGSFNAGFDSSINGIADTILVSLGSFFDFGYYRIYEAFLHKYPKHFFADEEWAKLEQLGKTLPDFWAHFMPGILYVIISTSLILIAVYS